MFRQPNGASSHGLISSQLNGYNSTHEDNGQPLPPATTALPLPTTNGNGHARGQTPAPHARRIVTRAQINNAINSVTNHKSPEVAINRSLSASSSDSSDDELPSAPPLVTINSAVNQSANITPPPPAISPTLLESLRGTSNGVNGVDSASPPPHQNSDVIFSLSLNDDRVKLRPVEDDNHPFAKRILNAVFPTKRYGAMDDEYDNGPLPAAWGDEKEDDNHEDQEEGRERRRQIDLPPASGNLTQAEREHRIRIILQDTFRRLGPLSRAEKIAMISTSLTIGVCASIASEHYGEVFIKGLSQLEIDVEGATEIAAIIFVAVCNISAQMALTTTSFMKALIEMVREHQREKDKAELPVSVVAKLAFYAILLSAPNSMVATYDALHTYYDWSKGLSLVFAGGGGISSGTINNMFFMTFLNNLYDPKNNLPLIQLLSKNQKYLNQLAKEDPQLYLSILDRGSLFKNLNSLNQAKFKEDLVGQMESIIRELLKNKPTPQQCAENNGAAYYAWVGALTMCVLFGLWTSLTNFEAGGQVPIKFTNEIGLTDYNPDFVEFYSSLGQFVWDMIVLGVIGLFFALAAYGANVVINSVSSRNLLEDIVGLAQDIQNIGLKRTVASLFKKEDLLRRLISITSIGYAAGRAGIALTFGLSTALAFKITNMLTNFFVFLGLGVLSLGSFYTFFANMWNRPVLDKALLQRSLRAYYLSLPVDQKKILLELIKTNLNAAFDVLKLRANRLPDGAFHEVFSKSFMDALDKAAGILPGADWVLDINDGDRDDNDDNDNDNDEDRGLESSEEGKQRTPNSNSSQPAGGGLLSPVLQPSDSDSKPPSLTGSKTSTPSSSASHPPGGPAPTPLALTSPLVSGAIATASSLVGAIGALTSLDQNPLANFRRQSSHGIATDLQIPVSPNLSPRTAAIRHSHSHFTLHGTGPSSPRNSPLRTPNQSGTPSRTDSSTVREIKLDDENIRTSPPQRMSKS